MSDVDLIFNQVPIKIVKMDLCSIKWLKFNTAKFFKYHSMTKIHNLFY